MTDLILERAAGRVGHLDCTCEVPGDAPAPKVRLGRIATVFALTVLSQALTLATLPIMGGILAPRPWLSNLPFALTLVGAVAATFPCALLTDHAGRRHALAIGAGLGLAGAGMAAWGFVVAAFGPLLLGSFWLGMGQGFGLFYRHATAEAGGSQRSFAVLLGCGGLAAVAAPGLTYLAQIAAGPYAPGAILGIVAFAQAAVVALGALAPADGLRRTMPQGFDACPNDPPSSSFWGATIAGGVAWFGMAAAMAGAPSLMVLCGAGSAAVSGMIAWHVLWMFASAALLGAIVPARRAPWLVMSIGLGCLAFAFLALREREPWLSVALAVTGSGWSLTMFGVGAVIGRQGEPSARSLATHDAALLTGAIAGALTAGLLA